MQLLDILYKMQGKVNSKVIVFLWKIVSATILRRLFSRQVHDARRDPEGGDGRPPLPPGEDDRQDPVPRHAQ